MRPKRQDRKNKQRRDLSLEDYQQEAKLEQEDSALSNFLRGRSTLKDRGEEQDQRKRPPTRQACKEEREKSYSFIDELTCLMDDKEDRRRQ